MSLRKEDSNNGSAIDLPTEVGDASPSLYDEDIPF